MRRVGQTSENTYKLEFQNDLWVQLDFILSIFSKFGKDGTEKFRKNQNFVQIRGATTMEKNRKSTSAMIEDVTRWCKEYDENFKNNSQFVKKFASVILESFIQSINLEEMVGTQLYDETEEASRKLQEYLQPFAKKLASVMAVYFIKSINLEMVSTQLQRSFKKFFDQMDVQGTEKMETIHTYKAMAKFHKMMERTGLLTVDEISTIH